MEETAKVKTAAIVLAAGAGKRMNGKVAKQYLLLHGKPVLYYSLHTFQNSQVDEIVLVIRAEDTEYVSKEIVNKYGFDKVKYVVEGGKERFDSVKNGLSALYGEGAPDYVLIHDGARPFLTKKIIDAALDCVVRDKACIVGMPVKDTVKLADTLGYIDCTPPRSLVWAAQTPQAFSYPLIVSAYSRLTEQKESLAEKGIPVTDDAGVLELFTDTKVRLVQGSYENIKITTPDDLLLADALYYKVFGKS